MIYPTGRAILIAAAIAPLALVVGIVLPAHWFAGLALLAFFLALCACDAFFAVSENRADVGVDAPAAISVGAECPLDVHVRFTGRAPAAADVAIDTHPLLVAPFGVRRRTSFSEGRASVDVPLIPVRRGRALIGRVWVRWTGPLGLAWRQRIARANCEILITPDIRPVREKAAQLIHRDAMHGLVVQMQLGEGAEFEALTDYRTGMDRRSIDWKQSARHMSLLAKEHRTERNNNIIIAVDSGRAMSEPLAGVPRIDRAVSAALLTAYVALKEGDRAGLFGFDSHPRVSTNALSGQRAFGILQRVAAQIDYSTNETNYTLALATLASTLRRRSLIVIFTEFTDTISAELMLDAVGALLSTHLVLFVVMRDEELEAFVAAEPVTADDVTRAVAAAALLRQRKLVMARLRRLGVHVVEASHDAVGPALVNAYVDFKRRNLL